MKKGDFENSKWCLQAKQPGTEQSVLKRLPKWTKRIKNSKLLELASDLKSYLTGGKASLTDKTLVVGGLLYLLSPLDLIPDAIPVMGWMDDIGVATFVLSYLKGKLKQQELDEEIEGTANCLEGSIIEQVEAFKPIAIQGSTFGYRVDGLRNVANELELPHLEECLNDVELDLMDPLHKVIFVGRFNVGKTSVINALLGKKYLREGAVPTTKTVHQIMYGAVETVCIETTSGNIDVYESLEEYTDAQEPSQISMFVPVEWLKSNVCILDTPGISDPSLDRAQITLEAIPVAHALVMVLDASYLLSEDEREFIASVLEQDRSRKMFFLLNKADKKSAQEMERIVEELKFELRKLGCSDKVFCVSAKMANLGVSGASEFSEQFSTFKLELLTFLDAEIRKSKHGYALQRLDQIQSTLDRHCDDLLAIADMDAQRRQQMLRSRNEQVLSFESEIETRKNKLKQHHQRLKRRFDANLENFISSFEIELQNRINAANLAQLKSPELLHDFVKKSFSDFLGSEFSGIQQNLGGEIQNQVFELQTLVQNEKVQVQAADGNASSITPEIVAPAILIATWPIMGLFSWIPLAVGVVVGKDFINTVSQGILEKVALSSLRTKILEQTGQALRDFVGNLKEKIEVAFEELLKDGLDSLETLKKEANLVRLDLPDAAQMKDNELKVKKVKKNLSYL